MGGDGRSISSGLITGSTRFFDHTAIFYDHQTISSYAELLTFVAITLSRAIIHQIVGVCHITDPQICPEKHQWALIILLL